MGDIRVFTAGQHDPWFNLATEDWLFKSTDPSQEILFLWRNQPCIVIGRFQNPWNECNLSAMEADGVQLARRQSGGGAVYHDLGNTNFTFMSPRENYDTQRNFSVIIKALATFGVVASPSGRNDMLVDGHKISGSAFRLTGTRAFHHGTLLINADMARLPSYLTPDKEKLASKGIQSVASRVANITQFNPSITHENLCAAIIQAFFNTYGTTCPVEELTLERLSVENELNQTYRQYADWSWRFGTTPEFSHTVKGRFPWGGITLHMDMRRAKVDQVKVFSDALSVEFIEFLQEALIGLAYGNTSIAAGLEERSQGLSAQHQAMAHDVALLIVKELG